MLKNFFSEEPTPVDEQIDTVLLEMQKHEPVSEEYLKLINRLKALNEIKTQSRRKPVSSDTIALIAGNLFGVLLIIAYEKNNITNSKAWQSLVRPKGS